MMTAAGEAEDDRSRDVLDIGAKAQKPGGDEDEAGQERGSQHAIVAVRVDERDNDNDEGCGWSADLVAAAAEARDQQAADDGGHEPLVRRHPGANGDRH
jgi:hypothetical protein